ncbi:hypothetical protein HID58_042266, partial [Brassica napus]
YSGRPDASKLRNGSRYSIETSIPTTLTSMLLLFLQARIWRIYIKGLRVFTAILLGQAPLVLAFLGSSQCQERWRFDSYGSGPA